MADGGRPFDDFEPAPDAPSPEELMRFELNDLGNAFRLIRLAGGSIDAAKDQVGLKTARLLYLRDHGWIGFDGVRWDLAHGEALARKLAHKVAKGLHDQAWALAQARAERRAREAEAEPISLGEQLHARLGADAPKKPAKKEKIDPALAEFLDFARASGNAGRTEAMLKQAQSYLLVDLDDFDPDPLIFNVRNGTLRWVRAGGPNGESGRAGQWKMVFRPGHSPGDRITRLAEVDYQPDAQCERFEAAVAEWLPDPGVRRFVRRIHGYGLTGDTSEQAFFIYQGLGGDGKSTLIGVLRRVAGDYAATADVKTFLDAGVRSGSDASSDVARLAGETRMVCTAEPPRGAKLNEAMIKSFTGGAPLPARRLRQEQFEFKPKGKVFLECNTRPVIKGDDEGIWRRIFIVMWEVRVPAAKRVKDLDRIIAREEGPGVLNWLMAGVGDWLASGLDPPKRVSQALEDYRKGSSPFGEWLAEYVVVDKAAVTPAREFFDSYKAWMDKHDGDAKPMGQTAFGRALGERQIIRHGKDGKGNVLRSGARLKSIAELEDDIAAQAGTGAGGPDLSEPPPPPEGGYGFDPEPDDDLPGAF